MEGIKEPVTDFCGSLDKEDVIATTANIRKRAKECLKARGGHFEFRLKKKTRGVVEARIVYEYKDMKPTKPNVLCRQSLQVKSRGWEMKTVKKQSYKTGMNNIYIKLILFID